VQRGQRRQKRTGTWGRGWQRCPRLAGGPKAVLAVAAPALSAAGQEVGAEHRKPAATHWKAPASLQTAWAVSPPCPARESITTLSDITKGERERERERESGGEEHSRVGRQGRQEPVYLQEVVADAQLGCLQTQPQPHRLRGKGTHSASSGRQGGPSYRALHHD
jgi:hypothetical protein